MNNKNLLNSSGHTQQAAYISLSLSLLLLILKFWAYHVTKSQAVFSDAMESIVNVVSAFLGIVVVIVAARPADQDHPYGHGKVEFFSAAFEGGLIAFAAILICAQAVQALWQGVELHELDFGILMILAAGVANLILGLYLLWVSKKHKSITLHASSQHVISDFWTSLAVVAGLIVVKFTKLSWLDPLVALIMGVNLAWTGFMLVRRSIGGLLDAEDKEILKNLLVIIEKHRPEGIIQVHHCRVMRSGNYHHIDAHVVIPEFWNIAEAHDQTYLFEEELMKDYPYGGELHLHADPCRRAYCQACEVKECPVRKEQFITRRQLSIEELTNPEEPKEFTN